MEGGSSVQAASDLDGGDSAQRLFPPQLPPAVITCQPKDHSLQPLQDQWVKFAAGEHITVNLINAWSLLHHAALDLRGRADIWTAEENIKAALKWLELLELLWTRSRDIDDLKLFQRAWNSLTNYGPQNGPMRWAILDRCCSAFSGIYKNLQSEHNFGLLRALYGSLVAVAHESWQRISAYKRRGRLYISHMDRFPAGSDRRLVLINTCIFNLNLALQDIEKVERNPEHDDVYVFQSYALDQRYRTTHVDKDLTAAMGHLKTLLERTPRGSEKWFSYADKLARAHWARYHDSMKIESLEESIAIFESILVIDDSQIHACTGLAEVLRCLCSHKVMSNIEKRIHMSRAIDLLNSAIVATAEDDPNLPSRLGKCSEALSERFGYDGEHDDIDIAIELQHTALALPQLRPNSRWFHLKQLCEKRLQRHNILRDEADLDLAVQAARKCVQATVDYDPKVQGDAKLELACALASKYLHSTHDSQHLQEAITNATTALEMFRAASWRSMSCLCNLGELYLLRFRISNAYDDAGIGLRYVREAIDGFRQSGGKSNNIQEAKSMEIMGKLLLARYEAFHAQEDLDEAVKAQRDVCQILTNTHIDYPKKAVNLSTALLERYRLTRIGTDIEEASAIIEVALRQVALRSPAASDYDKALLECQAGMVLSRKWQATPTDSAMLEEAISRFKVAAALEPDALNYFLNIATARSALAKFTTNLEDLEVALVSFRAYTSQIKRVAPQEMQSRAPVICRETAELIVASGNRYMSKPTQKALLVDTLTKLSEMPLASVESQTWAAGEHATVAFNDGDYALAARLAESGMNLLPRLLNPAISRADQLLLVRKHYNLPIIGLCCHVQVGHNIKDALQIFEQSRAILWNRTLQERDELDNLVDVDTELTDQFRRLHTSLSAPRRPLTAFEGARFMDYRMVDHFADVAARDEIVAKIRAVPGHEGFLRVPARIKNLHSLAEDGCIVVLNCVGSLAHAVLITKNSILNCNLLNFSQWVAEKLQNRMKLCLSELKDGREREAFAVFDEITSSLWRDVASPILDSMDEILCLNGVKPRIWWLSNRWVNVLPLHAAGDHSSSRDAGRKCTVLDRAVSSYTPTFGALAYARQQKQARSMTRSDADSLLVAAMSDTPQRDALAFAELEATQTMEILTRHQTLVHSGAGVLLNPSSKQVLHRLKTCTFAHLICHGERDEADPLLSRLLFSDHWQSKEGGLTVRTLIRAQMPNCDLVYLSACSSASSYVFSLADEGLHIAGAFLLAGVPHVIATVWDVVDEVAVKVANGFYERLCATTESSRRDSLAEQDHRMRLGGEQSAVALNHALPDLRDDGVHPLFWGAYAHFGA